MAGRGEVLMHFAMSLDGFVAGPGHDMSFLDGATAQPRLIDRFVESTGAVLSGRDGFDSAIGDSRPYGGKWTGPIFVLTHHPEDARVDPDITVLSCPVEEALEIAREAAGERDVEIFSANISAQLLELGLIDRVIIHVVPVLLGDGVRLYEAEGGRIIRLVHDSDATRELVTLQYRVENQGRT